MYPELTLGAQKAVSSAGHIRGADRAGVGRGSRSVGWTGNTSVVGGVVGEGGLDTQVEQTHPVG